MSKTINGPINVVRLEGEINKIKKVLYVFMDVHISLKSQTKCEDQMSDDVTAYIKKELIKTDKPIDFFMEHRLSENNMTQYMSYRDMYIEEMEKFFYTNFKNKTKDFDKIRFHYADVRDTNIIFGNRELDDILSNYACHNYSKQSVDIMLNIYFNNISYLTNIIDIFSNKKISEKNTKLMKSIKEISKSYSVYTHKNVQEKNFILIEMFIKKATKLIDLIKKNRVLLLQHETMCNEHFTENGYRKLTLDEKKNEYTYFFDDEEIINTIKKNHSDIVTLHMETHALIMDIYFLRRFCDKDYITNGIFYGGGAHGFLYINFLLNKYDFTITHVSYSSMKLDKINKLLKDKLFENKKNELFDPPVLIQCSDISDFPTNFQ